MMTRTRYGVVAACALAACGGDPSPEAVPTDGGGSGDATNGSDAGVAADVGAVDGADAGVDAGADVSEDAPAVDASADSPPDAAGMPSTVLVHGVHPTGVAVDSQFIYWAEQGDAPSPAIFRANLDGTNVVVVARDAATVTFPEDVVLLGDDVYWDNTGSSSTGLPAVGRCPKSGCTGAADALPYIGQFNYGTGLAATDGGLYWAGKSDGVSFPSVWRIDAVDGGVSGPIVTGIFTTGGVAVAGGTVYFGASNGTIDEVGSIAASSALQPLDAGSATSPFDVVTVIGTPPLFNGPQLAVDATNVYYADQNLGAVGKALLAPGDGGAPVVLASNLAGPMRVAVDDTNVYFTVLGPGSGSANSFTAGSIMTCPKSGCGASGPTVVTRGLVNLSGFLAVDATSVYFTVIGDGTVRRVAK